MIINDDSWGNPKIVGLQWAIRLKWMMTGGKPYFRKPPYLSISIQPSIYPSIYPAIQNLSRVQRSQNLPRTYSESIQNLSRTYLESSIQNLSVCLSACLSVYLSIHVTYAQIDRRVISFYNAAWRQAYASLRRIELIWDNLDMYQY